MTKSKYMAICPSKLCRAKCQVEEHELTERDKLYCQHCKSPLEFKYIEPAPEEAVVEQAPAPSADFSRLLAAVEALVKHPPRAVSSGEVSAMQKVNYQFQPNRNPQERNAEVIFEAFKLMVEEAAAEAISRAEKYLQDNISDYRLQQSSDAYNIQNFIQNLAAHSSGSHRGDSCYFYFYDNLLADKVKRRLGLY